MISDSNKIYKSLQILFYHTTYSQVCPDPSHQFSKYLRDSTHHWEKSFMKNQTSLIFLKFQNSARNNWFTNFRNARISIKFMNQFTTNFAWKIVLKKRKAPKLLSKGGPLSSSFSNSFLIYCFKPQSLSQLTCQPRIQRRINYKIIINKNSNIKAEFWIGRDQANQRTPLFQIWISKTQRIFSRVIKEIYLRRSNFKRPWGNKAWRNWIEFNQLTKQLTQTCFMSISSKSKEMPGPKNSVNPHN